MIRQSTSKQAAPSVAYAATNAVIWAIYAALVLLVPWVGRRRGTDRDAETAPQTAIPAP